MTTVTYVDTVTRWDGTTFARYRVRTETGPTGLDYAETFTYVQID